MHGFSEVPSRNPASQITSVDRVMCPSAALLCRSLLGRMHLAFLLLMHLAFLLLHGGENGADPLFAQGVEGLVQKPAM